MYITDIVLRVNKLVVDLLRLLVLAKLAPLLSANAALGFMKPKWGIREAVG